jgi:hypothetical protein
MIGEMLQSSILERIASSIPAKMMHENLWHLLLTRSHWGILESGYISFSLLYWR